ncbi:transcription factor HHO6 [Brachypodium distachyon]|uniref:HTH myb-type domain-containing protein n=1 Tax=Brachypodium distachyon TaxID=15368 RepID=I1IH02_BRADI|nr:transcription factor HHO6 [Brachypodium distachyon]KQJ86079.1 hypothetical protein BRADI_4g03160v3 [Brachypodium distachyon]|eukprot:XP_003579224.1 transcription factor HHO6 [Brachypodium distachyon]
MGPSSSSAAAARKQQDQAAVLLGGGAAAAEEDNHQRRRMRAVAARAVTDSLRADEGKDKDKAARLEECARGLQAEKAKMEVFRRELPISVTLIADVIEWLKDEVEQHRRPPVLMAPAPPSSSPSPAAKRKQAEADASDKRSWMSSAQLWTCGSHSNGGIRKQQAQKLSNAFMPLGGGPPRTTMAKSPERPEAAAMAVVPADLSLSSPAATADAAPSSNSSAVTTDAGAQSAQQQRKARRCWSPELHRRFVAALQRLGGPQVATPKQIREMMKVDGLTNDEVKSHLQKYRLHTRRASSSDGDHQHQQQSAAVWPPSEQPQYTASQHSTSKSGGSPMQLTGSSRATAGDSCDGEEEEEDGRSASYGWGMQLNGTMASSSS